MDYTDTIFCPNKNCKDYEKINSGNLKVKQYQGKSQRIALMECTTCSTTFSERKGTIYFRLKKSDETFNQVMMLLMIRASIKDIVRVTGVSEDTIGRWTKKAAKYLKTIQDFLVRELEVTECQVDELWSFVYMKKKTVKRQGIDNDDFIGDQWIFIAIDAVNKLIIHWKVGKRTLDTAKLFIKELKSKIASNPLYTSDELPAYEEAFLSNFCKKVKPEKTGKRGRPRKKIIKEVDDNLKLAQTHKHRKNGKVIKITEVIVFGNEALIKKMLEESPVSNCINTSFVERSNGTIRAKNSRLVRKTYSFSKKLEMHEAHLTIYFVYYNFIWVHSRLKKSAAWLAGLINKAYSFKELFLFRKPEFICGY